MTIAITGEKGFLGYHLTQYYKWVKQYQVVSLGRNYLENIRLLDKCDLLIHCAGVNRGDNVYEGNINLASELVSALEDNNIRIDIKFTSSTQVNRANQYGDSKLEAEKILQDYCTRNSTTLNTFYIPNLYGPFGKPNYNSFIATFCYNLNNNIECKYNTNLVDLCYVYDAIEAMDLGMSFTANTVSVKDVFLKLKSFKEDYSQGILPNLTSRFDLNLFNTFRSYANNLFEFKRHSDDRGHLVELVKGRGSQTQVFFSTTKPGITRGEHFHFGKIERFCVLNGTASIKTRKIDSKEINEYIISGDDNKVIDMPVLFTHNITNVGKEDLICVFWVNEIYDTNNPDTYYIKV